MCVSNGGIKCMGEHVGKHVRNDILNAVGIFPVCGMFLCIMAWMYNLVPSNPSSTRTVWATHQQLQHTCPPAERLNMRIIFYYVAIVNLYMNKHWRNPWSWLGWNKQMHTSFSSPFLLIHRHLRALATTNFQDKHNHIVPQDDLFI